MKLTTTEISFMNLIWKNEPLSSTSLASLCLQQFGWKKSTAYTFLKRLQERGVLINQNAVVTSKISKEEVQRIQSNEIVRHSFDGSLPQFVTTFLSDKKLSKQEIKELRQLVNQLEEQ